MARRPDYVHCILYAGDHPTGRWGLCGRNLACEWAFNSAEHARLTEERGAYQVPCPDCKKKAMERKHWWVTTILTSEVPVEEVGHR